MGIIIFLSTSQELLWISKANVSSFKIYSESQLFLTLFTAATVVQPPIFLCWIVPIAAQLAFLVLFALPPASSILNTATTVILLKVHQILVALAILFQFLQGLINSLVIKAKVLKLAYMSLQDLPTCIHTLASSPFCHSLCSRLTGFLVSHFLREEVGATNFLVIPQPHWAQAQLRSFE